MRLRTTPAPHRQRSIVLHMRLALTKRRAHCLTLRQSMARPLRCGRSGCRSPTSTRRPMRRCSPPTGTRARSSGIRSGPCSTMPISAAGLLEREQRVTGKNESAAAAEVVPELTRDVIDRMSDAKNARLQEVMAIVVRHLHAIVREAQLTQGEWWQAIDFLTRAGQMCSESRQELILLSDILGVSMLVDAVDNVAGPGVSDSTVLGPFYAGHQRELVQGDSILLREEEASEPL